MSQDDKHRGKRRKPPRTEPQATANTTVGQFAKRVANWLVEWADEDDIRKFVAEFEGVPMRNVAVAGDDIKIVAGH